MTDRGDDRRSKRTRKAVLDAFHELLHEKRYSTIGVTDVIARAEIGRSTFYDHFKSKDDLLLHSMAGIYAVLADVVTEDFAVKRMTDLLEHFWENRKLARELMSGPSAALGPKHGIRHLTASIETRLTAIWHYKRRRPLIPLSLVATQTAEGMMSLIKVWLAGTASGKPENLAKVLHVSARSSIVALLKASAK